MNNEINYPKGKFPRPPKHLKLEKYFKNDTEENKLEEESQNLKQVLLNSLDDKVLGPVNAPIYRVKGKYRQRLLIRSKKGSKIQNKLAEILNKHKLPSEIKLTVDVDPITFN